MLAKLSPETVHPTKPEIWRWFNKAIASAHRGQLNEQRVRNSLGWLQRLERNDYTTTLKSCSCPDHCKHPEFQCKHQIALMILVRIVEERKGRELQAKANAETLSGKYWTQHSADETAMAEQHTRSKWVEHLFATPGQIEAYKRDYPEADLVVTAKARGRKFRICDHRAEIV
jgi:predicted nucleic acid-binding Zn finger protein